MAHHYIEMSPGMIHRAIRYDNTGWFLSVDNHIYRPPEGGTKLVVGGKRPWLALLVDYKGQTYAPEVVAIGECTFVKNKGLMVEHYPDEKVEVWKHTGEVVPAFGQYLYIGWE